jgi:hypothetical protein
MKYLVFCLLLLFPGGAWAHLSSDSYLHIDVADTMTGQWDIALRDLDVAVGIDADGNGEITWGEVKTKRREIEAYAFSHLTSPRLTCLRTSMPMAAMPCCAST